MGAHAYNHEMLRNNAGFGWAGRPYLQGGHVAEFGATKTPPLKAQRRAFSFGIRIEDLAYARLRPISRLFGGDHRRRIAAEQKICQNSSEISNFGAAAFSSDGRIPWIDLPAPEARLFGGTCKRFSCNGDFSSGAQRG